jgi:hypothetical protein
MDIEVKMSDALTAIKQGHKAKLPEWDDSKFIHCPDGNHLIQSNFGTERELDDITSPWIDRRDWIIIKNESRLITL